VFLDQVEERSSSRWLHTQLLSQQKSLELVELDAVGEANKPNIRVSIDRLNDLSSFYLLPLYYNSDNGKRDNKLDLG
jgi:hypothetical protein